jgi:putative mycofactocin binding protein MftB
LENYYRLAEGVQVRKEKFGLLFYAYWGPRLYFVPVKNVIPVDFFNGHQSAEQLASNIAANRQWPEKKARDWTQQVITQLELKGLIHGQPVC